MPKCVSLHLFIIFLMCFCRSIINTSTIPGKVIIHYSQHDSQMGKEDHSESQGEGKKIYKPD